MARKLRIEYPGAIYHVMNRGDRREPIFRDEQDRGCFMATLAEACGKTGWQVHALCLMSNHFHLVVETPRSNLVAGMKWFLGAYTGRFNRRHKLFGHLFSGRYKALVVDGSANGYLRTVCDYVHLTTNFNFTVSSDTDAPVMQLYWPQDGAQLGADSFTCRGHVDDFTATVTASIVDSDGNSTTVDALVERDGNFWVENLPLGDGNNFLTLTARDAWNNVSQESLTIVKSAVNLTINDVPSDQLWNPTVTVTGAISASGYTVWVNGVKATDNGGGIWQADNVPTTPGGTAVFQARAIPNTDNEGNGTGDSDGSSAAYDNIGNPRSDQARDLETQISKPQRLYIAKSSVNYRSHWHRKDYGCDANKQPIASDWSEVDYHNRYEPYYHMEDRKGAHGHWEMDEVVQSPDDNHSSHCDVLVDWPFGQEYGRKVIINDDGTTDQTWIDPLTVEKEYCDVKNPPPTDGEYWLPLGSGYRHVINHWDYTRHASTEMKLSTGGKAVPGRRNLWRLSGSADRILDPLATPPFDGTPTQPIPVQNIIIMDKALGSDGNLWVALPDGRDIDVTPKVSGDDYYKFREDAKKYRLFVQANSSILQADRVVRSAQFIVGEKIEFTPVWSPSEPPGIETKGPFLWHLDGNVKNSKTNIVEGGSYPTSSEVYFLSANSLSREVLTNCWWVSGGPNASTPAVYSSVFGEGLTFDNGQYVAVTSIGVFDMYRPNARISPVTTAVNIIGGNLLAFQTTDGRNGITFLHTITVPSGFSGTIKWVKTISTRVRSLQDASSIWHSEVENGPSPWGDTPIPYAAFLSGTTVPVDSPNLPLPSGYVHGIAGNTFKMWMMFEPTGGIWVPLRAVNWNWSGAAILDSGTWRLSSQSFSPYPTDFDTQTYPVWKSDVRDRHWEPALP